MFVFFLIIELASGGSRGWPGKTIAPPPNAEVNPSPIAPQNEDAPYANRLKCTIKL